MNHFEIKISDLLKNPGQKDEIKFSKLFIKNIPNITSKGISGKIILQSINDTNIITTLQDISCEINSICDRCLSEFIRKVSCKEYKSRFTIPDEITKHEDEKSDDEIFYINQKSETINIEDIISQSIFLQEPISFKCKECISISNLQKNEQEDNEDTFDDYFESTQNIVFSKGK